MPVRRVAQPPWFLFISAAWPGGAAVAMEARSRLAGGRGGAGQGPGSRAGGEPGGWAWGARAATRPWEGAGPALPPVSRRHPAGPGRVNGGAVPEDALWPSALPAGLGRWERPRESLWDAPHPIGSPLRSQAPEGSRARAADSSCHVSCGALAYRAGVYPLGVFVCEGVRGEVCLSLCTWYRGDRSPV